MVLLVWTNPLIPKTFNNNGEILFLSGGSSASTRKPFNFNSAFSQVSHLIHTDSMLLCFWAQNLI